VKLHSAAEVAEMFGMPLDKFLEKRQREGWPHVRLGRQNVQFTDEQIAEIVAMQTRSPGRKPGIKVAGQTAKSAGRGRAS